jgi:hypothetical protein
MLLPQGLSDPHVVAALGPYVAEQEEQQQQPQQPRQPQQPQQPPPPPPPPPQEQREHTEEKEKETKDDRTVAAAAAATLSSSLRPILAGPRAKNRAFFIEFTPSTLDRLLCSLLPKLAPLSGLDGAQQSKLFLKDGKFFSLPAPVPQGEHRDGPLGAPLEPIGTFSTDGHGARICKKIAWPKEPAGWETAPHCPLHPRSYRVCGAKRTLVQQLRLDQSILRLLRPQRRNGVLTWHPAVYFDRRRRPYIYAVFVDPGRKTPVAARAVKLFLPQQDVQQIAVGQTTMEEPAPVRIFPPKRGVPTAANMTYEVSWSAAELQRMTGQQRARQRREAFLRTPRRPDGILTGLAWRSELGAPREGPLTDYWAGTPGVREFDLRSRAIRASFLFQPACALPRRKEPEVGLDYLGAAWLRFKRTWRTRTMIQQQRAYTEMARVLSGGFRRDVFLFWGAGVFDTSSRGSAPTPGRALSRFFANGAFAGRFCYVHEHNTSKNCPHRTERAGGAAALCGNKLKDVKGHWSYLKCSACASSFNRDRVATRNMAMVVQTLLYTGSRPPWAVANFSTRGRGRDSPPAGEGSEGEGEGPGAEGMIGVG